MGLDPGTPGSRPGPKAGTKPLSHPGIPAFNHFENHVLTTRITAAKSKARSKILNLGSFMEEARRDKFALGLISAYTSSLPFSGSVRLSSSIQTTVTG